VAHPGRRAEPLRAPDATAILVAHCPTRQGRLSPQANVVNCRAICGLALTIPSRSARCSRTSWAASFPRFFAAARNGLLNAAFDLRGDRDISLGASPPPARRQDGN
jgi:hypothetical protein